MQSVYETPQTRVVLANAQRRGGTYWELLFSFAGRIQKPEDLVATLGQLKPTTKLGEAFQYDNQLVAMGGFLAGAPFIRSYRWATPTTAPCATRCCSRWA